MQWHRNVVAESIIICNVDQEVHENENKPGREWHIGRHPTTLSGHDEPLNTDHKKLSKCHQVSDTRFFADKQLKEDDISTASEHSDQNCDFSSEAPTCVWGNSQVLRELVTKFRNFSRSYLSHGWQVWADFTDNILDDLF